MRDEVKLNTPGIRKWIGEVELPYSYYNRNGDEFPA